MLRRALSPHIPAALTAVLPSVRHRACVCLAVCLAACSKLVCRACECLAPELLVSNQLCACTWYLPTHGSCARCAGLLACCAVFVTSVYACGLLGKGSVCGPRPPKPHYSTPVSPRSNWLRIAARPASRRQPTGHTLPIAPWQVAAVWSTLDEEDIHQPCVCVRANQTAWL